MLLFWVACSLPACKRTRKCAGDPHVCFARWWPHVPKELKVRIQAAIKARVDGLSVQEAEAAGEAAVAQWRDIEARYGSQGGRAGA